MYFLTPFPEMVKSVVSESILGRAEKKELVQFHTKNLFDFADPPHRRIDDYPFGGGVGMVLKPEPVFRAFDAVTEENQKIPIQELYFQLRMEKFLIMILQLIWVDVKI